MTSFCQWQWRHSGVFIANFEHINFEQVNVAGIISNAGIIRIFRNSLSLIDVSCKPCNPKKAIANLSERNISRFIRVTDLVLQIQGP